MNQPNITLITVDSLRADHIYGNRALTPHIEELLVEGVTFETAIAQGPFTTFSMPSLFTSRYPSQLTRFELDRWGTSVMVGNSRTLPEALKKAGYQTVGIHSNPLISRAFGFDKGFDRFYDSLGIKQRVESQKVPLLVSKLRRLLRSNAYVPGDTLTDIAIDKMDDLEEPFFLWIHYMDVHGPYQKHSGFPVIRKLKSEWRWQKAVRTPGALSPSVREWLKDAYQDEVEFTDAEIGRLVEILREKEFSMMPW